jgi:tetratricopeptide (TPR) repeat protein
LRATALAEQASFVGMLGNYEVAQRLAQRALAMAEALPEARLRMRARLALGEILYRCGQFDMARGHFEQALAVARQAAEAAWEAECLRWLTLELTGTLQHVERALTLAQALNDSWLETGLLGTLGAAAMYQAYYERALTYWEKALVYVRAAGNGPAAARLTNNIADALQQLGAYPQALTHYAEARRIAHELGDRQFEAGVLEGLCRTHLMLGEAKRALEWAQLAAPLAQSQEDLYLQIHLHNNFGNIELAQEHGAEAAEHYRMALGLGQSARLVTLTMESRAGLARLALQEKNLAAALAEVEVILEYQAHHPWDGYPSPTPIYLACYCVLEAAQDRRAADLLRNAVRWLDERSQSIQSPPLRRSFLDNVWANRELWRYYQERLPEG